MSEFKFALGSRFRRMLDEYRVIGHTLFEDGSRAYEVITWPRGAVGYTPLKFDAFVIETDPQVKAVEE